MWGGAPRPNPVGSEQCMRLMLLETSTLGRRREELTELMRRARSTQYPNTIRYAHHVSGKVLAALAKLEGETRPRRLCYNARYDIELPSK